MNIIINKLIDNAMSTSAGDTLREKMEKIFSEDENAVITLDFSDVELYATPFFNRSTGYFFLKFGNEDIYKSKIKLINLDDLGSETYEYSLETARKLLEIRLNEASLNNILNNNDNNEEE